MLNNLTFIPVTGLLIGDLTMKISVLQINRKTLKTGKALVIESDITLQQYRVLANSMGFNIRRNDCSLVGYYYVDGEGDCLVTFPSFHTKGSIVTYN